MSIVLLCSPAANVKSTISKVEKSNFPPCSALARVANAAEVMNAVEINTGFCF